MTCHDSLRVEEVGLVVNPKFPHLGTSPDGRVHCKCCPPATLEIKCPLKYANMSIPDAIKSKDFCLGKKNWAQKGPCILCTSSGANGSVWNQNIILCNLDNRGVLHSKGRVLWRVLDSDQAKTRSLLQTAHSHRSLHTQTKETISDRRGFLFV